MNCLDYPVYVKFFDGKGSPGCRLANDVIGLFHKSFDGVGVGTKQSLKTGLLGVRFFG